MPRRFYLTTNRARGKNRTLGQTELTLFRRLRIKLVEKGWTDPFLGYTRKTKQNRSRRKRGR